ncbi:hypothetical protein [Streptomyces incanus]|uniref:Uncharacterized protein n=1 Tax=Streptomyces incanus TaxID=887453 RepID=A0ABW0XX59_9ACTN
MLLGRPRVLGAEGDQIEMGTQQGDLTQEARHLVRLDLQISVGRHGEEAGTQRTHQHRSHTVVRQDSNPAD